MQQDNHPVSGPEPVVAPGPSAATPSDLLLALLAKPLAQPPSPVPMPMPALTSTLAAVPTQAPAAGDIVIGTICALGDDARPCVAWPAGPDTPTPANSLAPVSAADIGRSVALGFPAGADQPLILGFVWQPGGQPLHAEVDGQHVQIEAAESITLRCGQASITLTADGQVLLRGTYVSSHSSGTQRIKGAAVRIN